MIEETTTKIIHFAHDNKCDTASVVEVMDDTNEEISGPRRVAFAQRSILKKTTPTLTPDPNLTIFGILIECTEGRDCRGKARSLIGKAVRYHRLDGG